MKLTILASFFLILLTQFGCQSLASRSPAEALSVKSHTASDSGFAVNSHLIIGARSAILIDAQFTRSEARKVVEMIKQSGRDLKIIFVTHGHPDHYLGLEVISKEFPSAKVLATPEVISDIKNTAQAKITYWKTIYKDDLADTYILPEPLNSDSLNLDGEAIQVVKLGPGESKNGTALYVPSLEALISGDLVYNEVHLWLAEDRPDGWLKNLETVKGVGPIQTIFPGHGPSGSVDLLAADARYIKDFMRVTDGSLDRATAIKKLEGKYPNFKLPVIAELSVGARIK